MKRFAFFSCPCPAVGRLFQRPGAGKHRAWYLCAHCKAVNDLPTDPASIWLRTVAGRILRFCGTVESLMFQPSWHEATMFGVRAKATDWSWTHQRTPETVLRPPFGCLFQFHILSTIVVFMAFWDAATDGYTGSTL